jgi:outer membrane protein
MQRTALAVALSSLLALPAAHALSLQEAFDAALQNDPTFSAARASLVAAQERTNQSKSLTRPSVNLTASANATRTESKVSGFASQSSNDTNQQAGVQASMPLFRPANWAQQEQAKLSEQIADAQLASARQDLILRLSQAYFDVLAAQDTVNSIAAQKKAVSEQLAQAKREFEVGTKTIVDTHEAQARFDQIVAQEAVAQGDLITKQSALAQITGKPTPLLNGLVNKPSLRMVEPASMEDWVSQAERGNYGVVIAGNSLEIAKRDVTRSKAGNLPTVDLVGNVGANRSSGSISLARSSTGNSATVGVQMTWPLYAGGAIDARLRETIALEDKARLDLESAKRTANQGAKQAYLGVTYGLAQVRALEAAEISATSQLNSTRLGYQVGVRINLEVLNAEQQLAQTRTSLLKSRYDTLLASLRLKSAAGQLGDEDLKAVNAYLSPVPVTPDPVVVPPSPAVKPPVKR